IKNFFRFQIEGLLNNFSALLVANVLDPCCALSAPLKRHHELVTGKTTTSRTRFCVADSGEGGTESLVCGESAHRVIRSRSCRSSQGPALSPSRLTFGAGDEARNQVTFHAIRIDLLEPLREQFRDVYPAERAAVKVCHRREALRGDFRGLDRDYGDPRRQVSISRHRHSRPLHCYAQPI
ncbi:hypothetical protein ALC57_05415, partial [Trachymyrmex cornetzi]